MSVLRNCGWSFVLIGVVVLPGAGARLLTTDFQGASEVSSAPPLPLVEGFQITPAWRTFRAAPVHMLDPGQAGAAAAAFRAAPSVETALQLCRVAATNRDVEPDQVIDALLTVEKEHRETAKGDGGALSRATLASLDGAWRLVFTTGTAETQKKFGRRINYFPLRATQTFDTATGVITNGIYIGSFPVLKFFGTFEWLEDRRRLEFDFDSIAVFGLHFDLPKGGAESLGAASGLGAESNVQRAEQGKKAFFNWISADAEIATARGGGGGLALWRRDAE